MAKKSKSRPVRVVVLPMVKDVEVANIRFRTRRDKMDLFQSAETLIPTDMAMHNNTNPFDEMEAKPTEEEIKARLLENCSSCVQDLLNNDEKDFWEKDILLLNKEGDLWDCLKLEEFKKVPKGKGISTAKFTYLKAEVKHDCQLFIMLPLNFSLDVSDILKAVVQQIKTSNASSLSDIQHEVAQIAKKLNTHTWNNPQMESEPPKDEKGLTKEGEIQATPFDSELVLKDDQANKEIDHPQKTEMSIEDQKPTDVEDATSRQDQMSVMSEKQESKAET
jgi:hypothetical protein